MDSENLSLILHRRTNQVQRKSCLTIRHGLYHPDWSYDTKKSGEKRKQRKLKDIRISRLWKRSLRVQGAFIYNIFWYIGFFEKSIKLYKIKICSHKRNETSWNGCLFYHKTKVKNKCTDTPIYLYTWCVVPTTLP